MIFFSKDDSGREKSEARINELIEQEGQTVLGWRTAPVNVGKIGTVAQESAPVVRQVFIGANEALKDNLAFERKLYIIRKQAENWAKEHEKTFYFVSLSSNTIVYKGLLTPEQVDAFYEDLQDEDFVSAFLWFTPFQHKHVSELGKGAPEPLFDPQRGNQYAARQYELDESEGAAVCF